MSERTLPHNLEAERAVLGAIMVHAEALDVVGSNLAPGDFFRKAHGIIYAAILPLRARMVVPDLVTVKEQLLTQGQLDEIGGPVYLAGLGDGIARATNVEYYGRIVKEKAVLRNIIDASQSALMEAYSAELPAETVIANAERSFIGISQQAVADTVTFPDVMTRELYAMLEQAKSSGGRGLTGLSTGFGQLDAYTRGLQAGNVIILGGRPGDGKSTLARQISLHVAATHGPVLFASMEMSRAEIAGGAIAQLAQVDHHRMSLGRLRDDEESRVGKALSAFEALPFGVDDSASQTRAQLLSKARRMKARSGLAMVVCDYLQLMQRPAWAKNCEEAVSDNSRALKVMAGELGVPVLVLSQLNRAGEQRAGAEKRPVLSDLRESGAIEQDANAVFLLDRPQAKSDGIVTEQPQVELIIEKQRLGPKGVSVPLSFIGEQMRFVERQGWTVAA